MTAVTIGPATTPEELGVARVLFEEYGHTLDVPEAVQSVEQDLREFPGLYVPPRGALPLAYLGERAVGCAALRPWHCLDICEMKRLYVRPEGRGRGVGRSLAHYILDAARAAGYRTIRLDTLGSMHAASALYRSLGFYEIAPYTEHPLPTARHMELILR